MVDLFLRETCLMNTQEPHCKYGCSPGQGEVTGEAGGEEDGEQVEVVSVLSSPGGLFVTLFR